MLVFGFMCGAAVAAHCQHLQQMQWQVGLLNSVTGTAAAASMAAKAGVNKLERQVGWH